MQTGLTQKMTKINKNEKILGGGLVRVWQGRLKLDRHHHSHHVYYIWHGGEPSVRQHNFSFAKHSINFLVIGKWRMVRVANV
jgi:hypothetical protein